MSIQQQLRKTGRGGLTAMAVIAAATIPNHDVRAQPEGASLVLEWNETAGAAAQAACLSPANDPLHEARMYAITQIAVHDALNSIQLRYERYAFQGQTPEETSVPAAIATAARDALVDTLRNLPAELFPPESGCAEAGINLVDARYTDALTAIPDDAAKTNGIEVGRRAAAAIVLARADDHANDPPLIDTTPRGGAPGEYQFTPGTPFAFAPMWGDVTPFALRDSRQFASGPPYALASRPYADDFNEVKRLGGGGPGDPTPSARTPEQTQIALFWLESSPLAWNRMARTISSDRQDDEWQAARLFALLNIGMVDGYIGTFAQKYHYNFWRPVTAIHRAAEDNNRRTAPDPNWQPLVGTPPIPDHDSGHAVEGAVAAEVMRLLFDTDDVQFSVCSLTLPVGQTCEDPAPVRRSFERLSEAAAENGESRILVGFHFRHAVTDGMDHGRRIGNWTVRNYLNPVEQ